MDEEHVPAAPPGGGGKSWAARTATVITATVIPILAFFAGSSVEGLRSNFHQWTESDADRAQEALIKREADELALIVPLIPSLSTNEPTRSAAAVAAMQQVLRISASRAASGVVDPLSDYVTALASGAAAAQNRQAETTPQVAADLKDKAPPPPALSSGPIIVGGSPSTPTAAASAAIEAAARPDIWKHVVVYIQVDQGNVADIALANDLNRKLNQQAIFSPGVQRMATRTIPNYTQVRYFNPEDAAAANALAAIVKLDLDRAVVVTSVPLTAARGTLEIWLGLKP